MLLDAELISGTSGRTARDGLRPFFADGLGEAIPALARGFPNRDRGFWERGFARLGDRRAPGPAGYLLGAGGADVGVLLTFRSERTRPDGTRQQVVNLAGWSIDPEHRFKAPMMLRRVLADADTVFSDLTPSPAVERMNTALGFETWNEGQVVTLLPPLAAFRSSPDVEVVAAQDDPAALGPDRDLVEHHAALGCIACVLRTDGRAMPLLFGVSRRMGMRRARLIYAESRRAVLANRAAIARFLLARGILAMTVDADRADCPRGGLFRRSRSRFVKGATGRDRLDYAFSELVLLDLES